MTPERSETVTVERATEVSDALWSALDDRDWDRWFDELTPDFLLVTDPQWPGGGEFRGREEVLRFTQDFLEPWESLRYERRAGPEIIEGQLLEQGAWLGAGRTTHIDGRIDFTVVGEFREGLMSRLEFFIEHDDALAFIRTGERPG